MEESNNGEKRKPKAPNVAASSDAKVTKGWIPKGEILEFAGRKIPGMVYFGNPEELECSEQERQNFFSFFIDPTKPVAEKGGREFDVTLHSHDYGRMRPECRANYLDWLEGGRHDPNCSTHYPMLYCIGLEHRFFNATPGEKEELEIFEEVEQLFGIYGWDSSIERIVANFPFDMVDSSGPDEQEELNDYCHFKGVWFDPDEGFVVDPEFLSYLKAIIECGEKSANGKRLDAHDIFPILVNSPPDKFHYEFDYEIFETPYFKELFQIRLDQNYPRGYKIRIDNRDMANALKSLQEESKFPSSWVDFELTEDIDELFDLADEVSSDLHTHTSFIKSHPDKENCIDALLHLPTVLWDNVSRYWDDISGKLSEYIAWAQNQVDQGTHTTAEKVVEDLNLDITFNEKSRHKWLELDNYLRACGFGIAPDYFLRYRVEKPGDPIMIYKLESRASQMSPESNSYVCAVIRISIGAYLLHAVGKSPEESAEILTEMVIQSEKFSNDQRRGLEANLKCILTLPHDQNFIKQWRGVPKDFCRNELSNFLMKLAILDAEVQAKGIEIIEEVQNKLERDFENAT